MAQFKKKLNYAEKHVDRCERMRSNGVKPQPLKASKTDHCRVGEAWREVGKHKGPNSTQWRGATGKNKLRRGPSQPKV